jgi:nitroreductase/NAD-dependent dihydropyrimidine dehydrogenase PreA subunit
MAIPTSRTKAKGTILLDTELCHGCGRCVQVCKDFSLKLENGKVALSNQSAFGCIACGHCMAICPEGAIQIQGRTMSPADLFPLPNPAMAASYEQILATFERRRSIREFKDQEVSDEMIEKILRAARTSPMGLPPSDVNVLVIHGKERNRAFAGDFCNYLDSIRWFISGWFLTLMRPFWGKENDQMFRQFLKPAIELFIDEFKKGNNWVNYDAPVSFYFYGSPYTDPADTIVAATHAMIAAESLGLGTCMLGLIHPCIQKGKKAAAFRQKHGIRFPSQEGLVVIAGYPDVDYKNGIRRTFASETHLKG